jgi:hypothetical protein
MIRAMIALLGVLAATACTPLDQVTQSIPLGQGAIIATSPSGYCIDSVASQPARNFAILAPCVALGHATSAPNVVGVATVQVGPEDSGQIAADELALRDFLITNEGARMLSAANDPEAVDILSTQAFDDRVMVHFTDQGPPPLAGLQKEEWRAFANINGRLVTVSVRGLATAPLRDGPGATLLKQVLAGVRAPAPETTDTPSET